jgi:hypothetical protein
VGGLIKKQPVIEELLAEFYLATAVHQPELMVFSMNGLVVLKGRFIVLSPEGPFDTYNVYVAISANFPWQEPMVFETVGRIPRVADRHVFESHGNCCLGVWEEWLLRSSDHSAAAFLTGPLQDYFLSQSWYEDKDEWPFGDRSHGRLGILEAYCDLLGIGLDLLKARAYLIFLSKPSTKGHYRCPCGSGLRLRHCHGDNIDRLRKEIPPIMAQRMFLKLFNE